VLTPDAGIVDFCATTTFLTYKLDTAFSTSVKSASSLLI
jgi:hypothetical protein